MVTNGRDMGGRFAPGSHHNPNGRPPRALCVTDCLRRLLGEPLAEGRGMTRAEGLARVLLNAALRGDRYATREILDRVEGRSIQTIIAPDAADALRIIRSPVPIPDFLRGAGIEDLAQGDDGENAGAGDGTDG